MFTTKFTENVIKKLLDPETKPKEVEKAISQFVCGYGCNEGDNAETVHKYWDIILSRTEIFLAYSFEEKDKERLAGAIDLVRDAHDAAQRFKDEVVKAVNCRVEDGTSGHPPD